MLYHPRPYDAVYAHALPQHGVELHFTIEGAAPAEAIERAIALSREKYCSVWHSMRQDIDFQVTFERAG